MDDRIYLDEINPHSVLRDLLRNCWMIVLAVASVYLCLSAYEKIVYEPEYTSSATFMVSAKDSSSAYTSLSVTREMAQVFSEVFQSNVLWDEVEEQMGEPLDGYILTNTIPETNLMVVSVVSSSPEKSFRALNLVIENYSTISDLIFGNAVLEVIKDPVIPMSPSNRFDTSRYQKTGMLLAALLMVGAIAVLSVMRDTIQTPKAAKRKLDGRLLRSIRHEDKNKTLRAKLKRKNVAPLISNPLISTGFREDNLSLCASIEYHMRKRDQKVIMICSAGENEGKSTVSANLALAMAADNKRVLLLDCDFRKPALQKIFEVDIDRSKDFGSFINHGENGTDFLIHLSKQDLYLGANASGYKNAHRMVGATRLRDFLTEAREKLDYIVIDTPPMLISADVEALAPLVDVSLLVVRKDFLYTKNINDCIDTLRRSTADMAGIVLNNMNKGYHTKG